MPEAVIVFVCRKRHHRSIAAKQLTYEVRKVLNSYFGVTVCLHGTDKFESHICKPRDCDDCRWAKMPPGERKYNTPLDEDRVGHAMNVWAARLKREIHDSLRESKNMEARYKPSTAEFVENMQILGQLIKEGKVSPDNPFYERVDGNLGALSARARLTPNAKSKKGNGKGRKYAPKYAPVGDGSQDVAEHERILTDHEREQIARDYRSAVTIQKMYDHEAKHDHPSKGGSSSTDPQGSRARSSSRPVLDKVYSTIANQEAGVTAPAEAKPDEPGTT